MYFDFKSYFIGKQHFNHKKHIYEMPIKKHLTWSGAWISSDTDDLRVI